MLQKLINFNNKEYFYNYSTKDNSGLGCIIEIIDKGEYGLQRFENLENKTFIDIGANHGLATIILAKQNPKSKIYSFEPNPNTYIFLEKNIKDNNLDNVILFNKALHTKKGLKLIEHPNCSGASILSDEKKSMDDYFKDHNLYNRLDVNEINVETISLDNFLIENNINNIFLLKIDCEGSEFDILLNSKELFKKVNIENIIGEFHNLSYNKSENNSEYLLNYCKEKIKGIIDVKILTMF